VTWHQADSQRRQFGRRDTSTRAVASIPGHASIPCELRNVSEGGALVAFDDGFVPNRPFKLLIDGTTFNILCEVRHHSKHGVGVRFLNQKDGTQLMRHLYPEPVSQSESTWKAEPDNAGETPAVIGNRELREGLIAAREAVRQAQRPAARPLKKSGFDDRVRAAMLATALKCAVIEQAVSQSRSMANKSLPPFYCAG
jgi:hypothetical protein